MSSKGLLSHTPLKSHLCFGNETKTIHFLEISLWGNAFIYKTPFLCSQTSQIHLFDAVSTRSGLNKIQSKMMISLIKDKAFQC